MWNPNGEYFVKIEWYEFVQIMANGKASVIAIRYAMREKDQKNSGYW